MDQSDHELLLPLVDEESICLPLPINVVSKYWNVELPMQEAKEMSKQYPDYGGSIIVEGIELAERHGLACRIVRSSLYELKKIIDSGIPPIVILPGIPEITQHASIVTGYDTTAKTILHYIQKGNQEGELQEGAIPEALFDKEWSEEGRLVILLGPPDILSSIKLENSTTEKSNRLCFISERSRIQKDFPATIESLKQAIELDPDNSTALNLLGSILNEQNSQDCLNYYKKSVAINTKSYLSYNGMGNFHLKLNQLDSAKTAYTKAIEINPKRSAKIYKNRAYILDKQGKGSEAKEDLKTYLKLYPKAPDRGVIEQAIREL